MTVLSRAGTKEFGSHRWLHRTIRTILAAAAFIAMVVLVLGGPANARGVGPAFGIRLIAFIVAVVASMILLRMGRLPKNTFRTRSGDKATSTSPTPQQLLDARVRASLRYSPEALDLFSRMLQDSSKYAARAIEDVEVCEGCLRLQTVMEFALSNGPVKKMRESKRSVMLLPLIKLAKGATLDNLEICDCEGRHVSALLQDELYGLLAIVIESLFRSAYINGEEDGPLRKLSRVEDGVLQSLIQVVCNPERIESKDISSTIRLLDGGWEASPPSSTEVPDPSEKDAARYLRDLCEFFADNYLIAVEAEIPVGSRLSMKYCRTVPLYEQTAELDNRWRVRLGLSPRSFTVPLTLPFQVPSYHFSLAGVPGSFVASQKLIKPPDEVIEQETFKHGNARPFLSTKCESALPYTHLHTRGLQRFVPIDMWTRVEFEEVPPGALGGALVVSSACAILIWFFTLVQPGLRGRPDAGDLPALLLTVPAFAATWIGNSVDRVQRSSISTYIGLGVSTIVSIGSSLLYIANASHRSFFTIGSFTFYHGLVRLKHVDATWLLLALIASIMSAYLAETLRDKVSGYMRLLANDSGFHGDY